MDAELGDRPLKSCKPTVYHHHVTPSVDNRRSTQVGLAGTNCFIRDIAVLALQTAGCIFGGRRRAERNVSVFDALDMPPYLNKAIDCTILDLSEAGAQIELILVDIVPDTFRLFVPERHTLYQCTVVRKSGKQVGLEFESRIDLKSS